MDDRSKWFWGIGLGALAASVVAYFVARKPLSMMLAPDLLPIAKQVIAADRSRLPCSTFAVRVMQRLRGWSSVEGSDWYADMQIFDRSRPWSPVEVNYTGRSGVGQFPRSGEFKPSRWYLAQGWRSLTGPNQTVGPGDRGHTFFWYATSPAHGYKLESDETYGPRLNGSPFNAATMLTSTPLTWQSQCDTFKAGIAAVDVVTG
jgi:hypothetical protein